VVGLVDAFDEETTVGRVRGNVLDAGDELSVGE